MSKILHEADNVTIKGHTYDSVMCSTEWGDTILKAIHIDCSILINGKLKTIWWSFAIQKEDGIYQLDREVDRGQWNMFYSMLYQLWYKIESPEVIQEWINKIME